MTRVSKKQKCNDKSAMQNISSMVVENTSTETTPSMNNLSLSMSSSPNVVMELKTIQASIIKNLFESIREILVDINIVFTADCIHCTSIDGNKCACVHFRLETSRFEQYVCKEESVIVGVNMFSLHKLIKPISNGDTITMRILKNQRYKLYIIIENIEKHTKTTSVLKLLDIDQSILSIPDIVFDNVVTIPCIDFQRHCKDMMTISDKVTFLCNDYSFVMKCNGDFADLVIEIERMKGNNTNNSSNNSIQKKNDIPLGFQACTGTFSLKYINLFIKSSALCSNVEIYLKKGYPLILVYRIGSLGKVQFLLAPIEQDEQDEEEVDDDELGAEEQKEEVECNDEFDTEHTEH